MKVGGVGIEGRHLLGLVDVATRYSSCSSWRTAHRAVVAVEQQAHAGRAALHRADGGDGAHAVEHLGRDVLEVFALRNDEDLFVLAASAASMARRVPGRPAAIGEVTPGKRPPREVESRVGSMRSVMWASCGGFHRVVS